MVSYIDDLERRLPAAEAKECVERYDIDIAEASRVVSALVRDKISVELNAHASRNVLSAMIQDVTDMVREAEAHHEEDGGGGGQSGRDSAIKIGSSKRLSSASSESRRVSFAREREASSPSSSSPRTGASPSQKAAPLQRRVSR